MPKERRRTVIAERRRAYHEAVDFGATRVRNMKTPERKGSGAAV
jgi:hypothetical protein